MTTKLTQAAIGLNRCAVCKIDLKGRFVFIDDRTESLLGLTKEELFGKTIFDFLDLPSQTTFQKLLSERNNYETFYDTTEICLVNKTGDAIKARIVVTLNFIAGNPVNFQIIIDHFKTIERTEIRTNEAERYRYFVEKLRELGTQKDIKSLADILLYFSAAESVCFYLINGEKLEERTIVSNEESDFAYKDADQPGKLHYDTACLGSIYSFINPEHVQSAIENYGQAPNEYLAKLNFWDNHGYLLRFIFKKNIKPTHAVEAVCRIETALEIMANWYSSTSADTQEDAELDIRFVVGFLDTLKIPALLLDSKGDVTGYNRELLNYFDAEHLNKSYVKLFERVTTINDSSMLPQIIDYVTSSSVENQTSLNLSINLTRDNSAEMVLLKLSDLSLDLSSCIVFLPEISNSSGCGLSLSNNSKFWIELLKSVNNSAEAHIKLSEKILHKYYNPDDKKSNKLIERINRELNEQKKNVEQISLVMKMAESKKIEQLDLNLILNDIVEKLIDRFPDNIINCSFPSLEKINSDKNGVKLLIELYLFGLLSDSSFKNNHFMISSEIIDDNYQINITDSGCGHEFKKILNQPDETPALPKSELYLIAVLLRNLLTALNGSISNIRKVGRKESITIILPNKPN